MEKYRFGRKGSLLGKGNRTLKHNQPTMGTAATGKKQDQGKVGLQSGPGGTGAVSGGGTMDTGRKSPPCRRNHTKKKKMFVYK